MLSENLAGLSNTMQQIDVRPAPKDRIAEAWSRLDRARRDHNLAQDRWERAKAEHRAAFEDSVRAQVEFELASENFAEARAAGAIG